MSLPTPRNRPEARLCEAALRCWGAVAEWLLTSNSVLRAATLSLVVCGNQSLASDLPPLRLHQGEVRLIVQQVRQIFSVLRPSARRRLLLAMVGSTVLGLLEAAGLLAIYPLMLILTGASPQDSSWLRGLSDISGVTSSGGLLSLSLAVMITSFVFKGVMTIIFRWWILGVIYREEADTATRLLQYYLAAPWRFHLNRPMPDLLRTMNDATSAVFFYSVVGLVTAVAETVTLAMILGAMVLVSPWATLAFVVYFGLASMLVARFFRGRTLASGTAITAGSLSLYRVSTNALGGVKALKLSRETQFIEEDYLRARLQFAHARRRASFFGEAPKYVLDLVFVLGVAVGATALVQFSSFEGALQMLALFVASGFRTIPSVARLLGAIGSIRTGAGSLDLVSGDVAEANRIASRSARRASGTLDGGLEITNLWYSYPGSHASVLRGVNISVPARSSLALVGPSGSGKSTLVDLMIGLLEPSSGTIRGDGRSIQDVMDSWQDCIGYVPQDVFVAEDSVRANVAFGVDPIMVDDDLVWSCLRAAQLDDVVSALPGRLDASAGERGSRLSGGQRQRLGIARALYRGPKVLFLDEATSALDSETERRISDMLGGLQERMTVVIVAHRLSTVKHCDQIAVLEGGQLSGSGEFESLMARNPTFRNLVTLGRL